jgi:type I restriction enzyme S subunit
MVNIQGGRLDLTNLKYIKTKEDLGAFILATGDILFNRTNSPELVGKAAVYEAGCKAVFASYLIRLRCDDSIVSNKFVCWWINSSSGREWAHAVRTDGVSQSNINASKLLAMEFPLPPLAEQQRIVTKIEALLARADIARQRLAKVPAILKRFRQSVLAVACSGRLTADWPARASCEPLDQTLAQVQFLQSSTGRAATDDVIPGRCILSVGAPGLSAPLGWRWLPLGRVARLESGHTPSRKHPEYWGGDIPWIGIQDAREHHGGRIGCTRQNVNELGLKHSAARLLPENTVCLSRTASVGYVVIMGRPMATSQDFVNWVCSDALVPEFLMYALLAEGEDIKRFGRGTTHTTIYYPEVKALHICLPPVFEQHEIVRRVEALFRLADAIETRVAAATVRAEKLTQAILAKAFRGELVPTEAELARQEGRDYDPGLRPA